MDEPSSPRRHPDPRAADPSPARATGTDTLSLINRAQAGDDAALEALCVRFQPRLYRWATGRLPARARGLLDTADIVQETLVKAIRRIDGLEPRGPAAFPTYLRAAILNRIRDELRRAAVRPDFDPLHESTEDSSPSPLEQTIGLDEAAQYEQGLAMLKEDDQAAIFMRLELGMDFEELADALDKPSPDAARMAVNRAVVRLTRTIHDEFGPT
jgi:RNA polymerase sigma-70 factor (ECF subfamily)